MSLRGPEARSNPRTNPHRPGTALVWTGALALVGLTLLTVVGRAITLSAGGEPFAAIYRLLPPGSIEDVRRHDAWMSGQALLTWTHIASGSLVVILALGQFIPWLRRRVSLHRWTGRLILLAAVPTAISGLALQARSPFGTYAADAAILAAGALFLTSLALAYRAIRRRDQVRHREWMIRMMGVALGVGMVRLVAFPVVLLSGRPPLELVALTFWLGFGLSVAAAEVWIRGTRSVVRG